MTPYDNEEWRAALADPTNRNFLPRTREGEQDAYFWFLTGQKSMLEVRDAQMAQLNERIKELFLKLEAMGVRVDD